MSKSGQEFILERRRKVHIRQLELRVISMDMVVSFEFVGKITLR